MRRKRGPGPAPFIDQFGQPAWTNPLGRYRPNPALEGGTDFDAISQPDEPAVPNARVQGWEPHERHFESAGRPTPGVVPSDGPAPAPAPATDLVPTPEHAQRVAELMRLLGEVDPAATPPAATEPSRPVDPADAPTPRTRAARLAERETGRRARVRLRMRRARSVAIAGAAVFGVTAAYGFWTGGADAGSRVVKTRMQTVAAEATAGMPSSPLTRGGTGNVKLRVDNPNAFAVTLTGVEGGPFPSAVNGGPGCTIANSGVTFTAPRTLNVNIPAKSTALVRLVGAAAMGKGAAPECRGHTFKIPVSIRVRKT